MHLNSIHGTYCTKYTSNGNISKKLNNITQFFYIVIKVIYSSLFTIC